MLIYLEKDSLLSNTNSKLLTASALFTRALEAQNFDIVDIVLTALAKPILLESQRPSGSAWNGLTDTPKPSNNNKSSKPSVNLYFNKIGRIFWFKWSYSTRS